MHVFAISKIFEKRADKNLQIRKMVKYVREKGISFIHYSASGQKIGEPLPCIISALPPLLTLINHEIKG